MADARNNVARLENYYLKHYQFLCKMYLDEIFGIGA